MDKIHWLHLSDIHLNKRDVDSRRMRNRLLDYVKELGTQIDYIFITGDLRYAPMGEFAADTVDYINKLLNVTNLTVDRLFIVPGNHDIERDAEGRAEAILESIKDYSPKDGALASDKMAAVHCGHTEFRKMMHTIYHENQEQAASYDDDEKPHFVTETKDFNIICIDTALTYTKQRNNNLFIGTEYIMDLLEELNQDKPSIILTHYSFDFLERSEQMQIVQLLKDFHVQLWLAGHEHTVLMRKQWDYFYEFQSGNLMHEGEYTRSTIMIGTYDSASYNGIVEVHEWDSDNGWFKMQNVGVHKEDYYAYELQNTKTMIDQIVSASHQNAGSPVRMEAELSAVPDKMEMDTFCGELSAAADIHQMPSEISSGYLYVDNRIAPTAQVEVLEYNIYGTKYYEIRNDGFEFKFFEHRISIPPLYTQQFEIGNLTFGYELSVYSNVADRLIWFNVISEIVNASTITIKFEAADEERILRLSIPGAGSSFDRIREETAVWKEQMERIAKIENYYGFKNISGKDLYENGLKQLENLNIEFVKDEVVQLNYTSQFEVTTVNNIFQAKYVVLATGVSRNVPNIKGIKEFEGKGVSYCAICDAFFYRNKDVAVLGSGNYAIHEAEILKPVVKSVTLLTNFVTSSKASVEFNEAKSVLIGP